MKNTKAPTDSKNQEMTWAPEASEDSKFLKKHHEKELSESQMKGMLYPNSIDLAQKKAN